MINEPTSAEAQEALSDQMKAPKVEVDPAVSDAFAAREKELGAQITEANARADEQQRRASAAEAELLAIKSGAAPIRASRQIPLWYALKADHATAGGDITGIVDDINTDLKDVPGFKQLSVGDFLALNAELLDADAKARGFDRGARWSSTSEAGNTTSGYHVFVGQLVLAGARDTTPIKAADKTVSAKVETKPTGEFVPTRAQYVAAGYTTEEYDKRYGVGRSA